MTYETLLCAVEDGVMTITLNRPDVLNAFNEQLSADLLDAFRVAGEDATVRAVVLTGTGRAFCSGQDLKDISDDPTRSLADSLRRRYNPLIRAMRALPKPILAAINGACAGAGLSLALACDMRFASERAKLIQVFIRIGLVPDSGSSWFMPHLVGYARAFELCATGRDVTAQEAAEIGLVNKVISPELLMDYTMTVAKRLATAPTQAIGQIKEMLNRAVASDLETALLFEEDMQEKAGYSHDYQEGKRAFLEKRPPKFEGR
ncbi:MAG: enoyl-CoA hydratase/isomerase family protein [Ignavibacteriae bacterium]|nr:enoyl-CoA hydratase/isomerase family protein [Ignavibacteriota bacterium]